MRSVQFSVINNSHFHQTFSSSLEVVREDLRQEKRGIRSLLFKDKYLLTCPSVFALWALEWNI